MKRIKSILALILALSLVLGIPFTAQASPNGGTHVSLSADGTNTANITVDGVLGAEEWGDPILSKTMSEIRAVDGSSGNWEVWTWDGSKAATQKVEVYIKRNGERVMLGVRLVDAHHLDKPTAPDYRNARCRIALAGYNYGGTDNVSGFSYKDQYFENFVGFTVQQAWNESTQRFTKSCAVVAPGQTPVNLVESEYAIGWDETTSSYFYEYSIPYSKLYGRVTAHKDIMLGVEISDALVDGKDCGNRWFISGAAFKNMDGGQNDKYGFRDGNPMRISFNDGSYVNAAVNAMPATAPTLDGSVSTAEWGAPTMVVSPNYASNTWTDSYMYFSEASTMNANKKARIWLTNDLDYIYIAATFDHETLNAAGTKAPTLGLMVGAQGTDTDLHRFTYNDVTYEKYYKFYISFDLAAATATAAKGEAYGVDNPATLTADEFEAKYDATTKTFTYEIRIPYSYTNISPFNTGNIAFAAYFASAHQGVAADQNRFCIGGPGIPNYPHMGTTPFQGRCLKLALNTYGARDTLAAGRTTALFEDIDMGDTPIVLQPGAYIDLNGHTLTAKNIRATQGDIIDGLNGQGALIIPKNGTDDEHLLDLRAGNRDLALYDTEVGGYRFYTYSFTHQTKTEETVAKFGMQLTFTNNEAYELLTDKDAADFDLSVTISSEAMSEDVLYSFTTEVLAEYAAKKLSGDGANWTIVLGVRGIEELTEGQSFTVTPTAKSGTGVGSTATALTFTK